MILISAYAQRVTIILLSVAMGLASASPAGASPLLIGNATFAKEGGITSIPVGAAQFCGSHAGGDLILDNLVGTIVTWNQTPYRYVKRQSELDAGRWVGPCGGGG